ncbi:MAG: ThuA domain-containing protein [Phycisphaerae bacterium]|nr:ThuA domain-containing protein [Phycisphaerae bacterium]
MVLKENIHCCLLTCLFVFSHIPFGTEHKIQVLIYSGSNNHNWKETTPELERILKNDPNFLVTITNHPETISADQLAKTDVVVSNWNNFGRPELIWPDSVRQLFINFMKNGGGHITIHAGGSSFNDWVEYHQITAYWGSGTGHGPRHEFTVKSTGEKHSIVQGIEPYETFDELWHNTHFPPESTVLMTAFSSKDKGGSGKDEPVLTVNRFGKGRCVNFMLGHDIRAMKNPGFKVLLSRSVKWAATETITSITNNKGSIAAEQSKQSKHD